MDAVSSSDAVKGAVDSVSETPAWKTFMAKWIRRIGSVALVHTFATKTYPWMLNGFYNRFMAADYEELLNSAREESVVTVEPESDDNEVPGGEVEF